MSRIIQFLSIVFVSVLVIIGCNTIKHKAYSTKKDNVEIVLKEVIDNQPKGTLLVYINEEGQQVEIRK